MKILHTVESYTPAICGMQEVVRQISERLAARGHEVVVATSRHPERSQSAYGGVQVREFPVSGSMGRGFAGPVEEYQRFLLESDFDVIANFAAQQWATDLMLPLLGRIRAAKVFVPTGFSGLHWPAFKEYFQQMADWMRGYDANVFLSNDYRDINFARQHGIEAIEIIPNGAAEEEFLAESAIDIRRQLGIPREHLLVLHVGSHTGMKGHAEAMRIFARARLRHATFLLIGNAPQNGCEAACRRRSQWTNLAPWQFFHDKHISIRTLSRPETVAAYRAADLFLFPSRVECSPIVLFECAASRTPFLSTAAGNAAEIAQWTGGGIILPTKHFADGNCQADVRSSSRMLEEIADDEPRRADMAERAFAAWRERFSWGAIALQYEQLYRRLSNGKPK